MEVGPLILSTQHIKSIDGKDFLLTVKPVSSSFSRFEFQSISLIRLAVFSVVTSRFGSCVVGTICF